MALASLLPDSKDAEIDEDASVDQMRQILRALQAAVAADSQSREAAGTKLDVLIRIARLMAHDKVNHQIFDFLSRQTALLGMFACPALLQKYPRDVNLTQQLLACSEMLMWLLGGRLGH